MEDLFIEANLDSPEVRLDYKNHLIEVSGKSYPGDSYAFYAPVIKWLEEYFGEDSIEDTTVNIKLVYFNSATSQILYNILDIVNDAKVKAINVNWIYNVGNEDSYEDYEDFAEEFPDLDIQAVKL